MTFLDKIKNKKIKLNLELLFIKHQCKIIISVSLIDKQFMWPIHPYQSMAKSQHKQCKIREGKDEGGE